VDGGRADDERSCPDTAAACLIRIASYLTRIDTPIRVDAAKKFRTRVSVTQALLFSKRASFEMFFQLPH